MQFEIIGDISGIELVASGRSIREWPRLHRTHGAARWRKMKGLARIRLKNGTIRLVELHWYEAHGIGRKELKIKRWLGRP